MQIATTHRNTDFDALASVVAATLLYPGCIGVIPKMTNRNVEQFLSTHKTAFNLILPNEVDHQAVTRLIVVDTDQWQRLDRMEKLAERTDLEIDLWDHHMAGGGDIEANWSCKERVGATVTLMVREMRRREMTLSPLDSTVLLIGLYEDTGHLTFSSTTAEDARAAAYLLDNRADLNVAGFFLNLPYEESQKEVLFEMMKQTEKQLIKGRAIGFNQIRLDKKVGNLAEIVSIYRKIISVDALFVIFSIDHRHTVIGRSGVEGIHIGQLLGGLGGGGHAGAGSVTIKDSAMNPAEIKAAITGALLANGPERVKLADIMSFPVVSISPEATMRQAQAMMAREKVRGLMVLDGEKICGIIVLWDLKKLKRESHWQSPVKAFMVRKLYTIEPSASPAAAARLMIKNDIGYLPVLQEGKLIGIVTRTDILTYYYDMLPE